MGKVTVILLFCVLFIPGLSFAQTDTLGKCNYTFSGKVLDGETREPLAGAVIYLKDINKATLSDVDGNFIINSICIGEYVVECKHMGFKSIITTLVLLKNATRNFVLHSDTCHMESVIVTVKERKFLHTQSITELKGKALDRIRGLSLGEGLKTIAGVNVLQTGPTIFKPVIQGMYGNRILILNNGVRQEGQQWGSEHAPEIDPFIASRITVIKGANSIRYGADAIGGVILIDPEEMRKERGMDAEVNLIGFSNNRQGVGNAIINYKPGWVNGLSFRVQGSYRRAGNTKTPDYYLKNTGFEEYNFSWGALYKNNNFNAEVFYSQFNTRIGIFEGSHIGNLTDLKKAIASDRPLVTSGFTYDINRPYQQVVHELIKVKAGYKFVKLGKLEAIIARQFNDRMEFDKHRPFNNVLQNKPQVLFTITTHTADLIYEHNNIGGISGSLGVNYISQANTTGGTSRSFIPNFESDAVGVFLIERWRQERFELEGGIRYDHKQMKVYRYQGNIFESPEFNFANFSGLLGGIYQINENLTGKINLGTAFRPVAVNELFSEGLHHGVSAVEYGNRNLTSEYAYNSSLTINYNFSKAFGEISVYNNYIDNFIYLAPGTVYDSLSGTYQPEYELRIRGAFPVFRYKQTNALFTGLDLTFNDSLSRSLIFSSKLSLLRAYNLKTNEHIVLTPPANFEYGFKYKFHLVEGMADTYLSLNHLIVLRKRMVPENQDFAAPPPGYNLLSLETGFRFFIGEQALDISFSVYNLLNVRYRDYMDRFRYFSDAPGRNFVLRLKVPINRK
ncbi:MAG: TonB-dependent receptor [Cytophagaceae bacterium]